MPVIVTNIIAILTAFLLLFFTLFLLFHKKGKRKNKILLAAFLFSNALYIIDFLLFRYRQYLLDYFLSYYYLGYFFGFLFGPLLYLYTRSLVYSDNKIRPKEFMHFIPFLVLFLTVLFSYTLRSHDIQKEILINRSLFSPFFWNSVTVIMNIQILVYLLFSINDLSGYSRKIKQIYSTIDKMNLSWLRIIIFAFMLMWLLDLSSFLLIKSGFYTEALINWIIFFSLTINFIFANNIIYKSLEHPEIYNGLEQREDKKYQKSTLSEIEKNEIAKKITDYLETERAYLKPDLSLSNLAEEINVNSKYISQVINERLDKNFFELINSYRIQHAQSLIDRNNGENKTILEVLYESGFNSKSVFNSVFKKMTGMTPSQYKKTA